jgi:hypothetical protein
VAAGPSSQACSAHTITAIPTSHSVSSSNCGDFGTGLRRDRRRLSYAAGAMTHTRCDCASDVAAAGAEQVRAPPVTARSVSAVDRPAPGVRDPPEGSGVRLRKSTPAANGGTGCDCQMTVQVTINPAVTSANDSDVLRLGPFGHA